MSDKTDTTANAIHSTADADSARAPVLQCRDIVFRRGQREVLCGVSIGLGAGEIVALLGVNGAGKSTVLRILLGLLKPDTGQVLLDDRRLGDIGARDVAKRIAYVPQTHAATFPYTVEQMVSLGRIPHVGLGRRLRGEDRQAVETALRRVDIVHLAHRPYTTLSGGEQQRVLIARSLAQGARVLVLDEAMAGLDYGHQMRLIELMRELAQQGYAILSTTHHPEQALLAASRAVLLEGGRVIADGPPRDVINAASMATLYRIALRQIDAGGERFFTPARSDSAGPDKIATNSRS
jgi:iron complex transport system ATP-binding protein